MSLPTPNNASPEQPEGTARERRRFLSVAEMAVFAMFGALMFSTTLVLSVLPNVHLLGMFIVLLTVVYRKKALIPIYIFVMIQGLYYGFAVWWIPYLYVWTVLWGVVMLLPRKMTPRVCVIVYPLVSGLHGVLFGTLYAPAQMLLYGYTWEQTLAWIAMGLPFDAIHGASNLAFGFLVYPLSELLMKLNRRTL